MDELSFRNRFIPPPEEVNADDKQSFEFFFDDKYLDEKLDTALQTLYTDPSLDKESREFFKKKYAERKQSLFTFFRNELLSVLSELNLLKKASKIGLIFESTGNASVVRTENGYFFIRIPVGDIIEFVFPSTAEDAQAVIIHDLAHEVFHTYLTQYTETTRKTRIANKQKGEAYDRDRGEKACELYAIHHLKQRAEQLKTDNEPLARACLSEVAKSEERLRRIFGQEESAV